MIKKNEIDEYTGDMIYISRLAEFFPEENVAWNDGETVKLDNITYAIHKGQAEEVEPFGDTWKYMCMKSRSTEWHIGRIIYFINHPEEIRDIEIDNFCSGAYIFPAPIIIDGNHRFMAALWLHNQGRMDKVHCRYGGRMDVLDYLTGQIDECPDE